jgi:hypothetical protein
LVRSIEKILKSREILNCHSPILTCLLLCEFLTIISEVSVQHSAIVLNLVHKLGAFCQNIQEANPDEKYIRFLMTQKDIKQRSVFQIAAENNFYTVMESPEIGTIVKKMWNGKLSYDSFFDYSSLYRFLELSTNIKSDDPYDNFDVMDTKKVYIFQLALWSESCSLRYLPESISSILILVLYNLYIYFLVNDNQMMTTVDQAEPLLRLMLYVYVAWTVLINLGLINLYIFSRKSNRKYKLDIWAYFDLLMMLFAFTLLIDTSKIVAGTGPEGEVVTSDWAYIIRAILLAINDAFAWFRLTGILLTFKEFGPIIRMIYLLSMTTAKYIFLYLLFMTCCVAIFTALFYKACPSQFGLFSQSFTTLFSGFINNVDVFCFDRYQIFGGIMMAIYVTLSGVLLINLMIAVLDSLFKRLNKLANALHRNVLIDYFRRYRWDYKHGYLLFLPTPLNVINFLVLPFSLFYRSKPTHQQKKDKLNYFKTQDPFNRFVCRLYFSIFYLPLILLLQTVGEIFIFPICYFKGIFNMIYHQFASKNGFCTKIFNVLHWIFLGIPFLVKMLFEDKKLVFKNIFKEIQLISYEKNRIKNYIEPSEVKIFLEFIHSRGKDKSNDLQSLFMDYLKYDLEKKAEDDETIKEKANYLEKLHHAMKRKDKNSGGHASILLYKSKTNRSSMAGNNNGENNKEDVKNSLMDFNRICKRNLIIIEILENFLIDDGSDNLIVDIEKLTNLLPKTTNIDNAYMKRLIYTDINSLNKALNKLKSQKNKSDQYKLLNKTVKVSNLLDNFVDNEVKQQKLINADDHTNKREEDDLEENEMYKEFNELLSNISQNIKESIQQQTETLRLSMLEANKKSFSSAPSDNNK